MITDNNNKNSAEKQSLRGNFAFEWSAKKALVPVGVTALISVIGFVPKAVDFIKAVNQVSDLKAQVESYKRLERLKFSPNIQYQEVVFRPDEMEIPYFDNFEDSQKEKSRIKRLEDLNYLEVKELQKLLNKHGYNLAVDGKLGNFTKKAFYAFKDLHNLTNPNEIGELTLTYLMREPKIDVQKFVKPTQGIITGNYGDVRCNRTKCRSHKGIDIANSTGTNVVAVQSGKVISAGWNDGGYGLLVKIQHNDGKVSSYAHLSKIDTFKGQTVYQGQTIGEMGSTGFSTGPHLHFELKDSKGNYLNPNSYINFKG